MPAVTANPGWYQDGVTPGVERWFDGRAWTEHTRPLTATPPAAPAAGAAATTAPAAGATSAGWAPQGPPPEPTAVVGYGAGTGAAGYGAGYGAASGYVSGFGSGAIADSRQHGGYGSADAAAAAYAALGPSPAALAE